MEPAEPPEPLAPTMQCPRCAKAMAPQWLGGHDSREIEVDLCARCQFLWFDGQESLRLTPASTLTLFRLIGEHVRRPESGAADVLKCPRCRARLRRTQDLQRATRFEYQRCPNAHGRLITFFDFLKEKDFIKPLTPSQIAQLRKVIQTVNCSNCGAAVDLARASACGHCGTPLVILDIDQAERLVAQLRDAEGGAGAVDPALPLALARARAETEAAFTGLPGHDPWTRDGSSLGLIGAGLSELMRLLKRDG